MKIAPWIRAKMRKNYIYEVGEDFFEFMIDLYNKEQETLHGRFFFADRNHIYGFPTGMIIAVDNSTGNLWTEEFRSVNKAVKWLCGESEEKQ